MEKENSKLQAALLERDLERLSRLRLMDDDFFSEALNGKKDAVEFILNTILGRTDLKVRHTAAQVEYKSAVKRSIRLDIWAEDSAGRIMDIEIQRSDRGTGAKRARYHSSMIDRTLLAKGEDFDDLADTYVIFITENDKFDADKPLYHIERKVEELGNQSFGDGAHIIYVNGSFQATEHPIGRLMHDFHCQNADDMINTILADEVRALKETEGGQRHMCRLLEEMREEAAVEAIHEKAVETAMRMLERGKDTCEEIADLTGLPIAEVQELEEKR